MAKITKPIILDETGQSIAEAIRILAAAQNLQVEELPTASATNVNKIYQYVGTTTNGLINGYFYKCIEDNGSYEWVVCNVQAASDNKADKVVSATAGNIATLDGNGNLVDSGVNGKVIPATAAVSNKLSTAADTAGEDITATANSEDIALTDAADARVHDLRIYGKTENGHSVGENGLTVKATGKNVLAFSGLDTVTSHGITFEPRTDGGIYVHGTLIEESGTTNVSYRIKGFSQSESLSQYSGKILSATGMPQSDYVHIKLQLQKTPWTLYADCKNNADTAISYGNDVNEAPKALFINIERVGTTVDTIIYPMIRDAQYTDTNFEEYKEPIALTLTSALPLRRKMLTVDLGDFDWEYAPARTYESGTLFNRFATLTTAEGMFDPTKFTNTGNVKEDGYLLTQESCSGTYTVSGAPGGHEPITDKTIIMSRKGRIYVIDNSYTDPAEFKAAVTGITLTYPSYCDEIDLADGVAITRLDTNGDVLATPVTIPLSSTEKAAFEAFRTFEGATSVTATDNPFMSLNYVKNTDNGKALANIDDKIKEIDISGKVDKVTGKQLSTEDYTTAEKTKLASLSPITISSTLTLTVAGWDSQTKQQTVLTTIDTTKRNVIDITVSELPTWSECNVYAISESATGVTFQCDTIPSDALTFKITSMVVTSNA